MKFLLTHQKSTSRRRRWGHSLRGGLRGNVDHLTQNGHFRKQSLPQSESHLGGCRWTKINRDHCDFVLCSGKKKDVHYWVSQCIRNIYRDDSDDDVSRRSNGRDSTNFYESIGNYVGFHDGPPFLKVIQGGREFTDNVG